MRLEISQIYEAMSSTDHAAELMKDAERLADHGDIGGALTWLRRAASAASKSAHLIESAISRLEEVA